MIKIFVGYHGTWQGVSDDVFVPLKLGCSDVNHYLLNDSTGESISNKNKEYCELTGIYWIWKNFPASEWVGFMHYRRYLDFSLLSRKSDIHGVICVNCCDENAKAEFGLNASSLYEFVNANDRVKVILPEKWSVKSVGYDSLYEQYSEAPFHFEKDLLILRDVIKELYPNDEIIFDQCMSDHAGYFTNIFVFKREYFDAYCQWIFPILFEFEKKCDLTNYSIQSRRVIGYLAERLMNIFIKKQNFATEDIMELPRIFFNSFEVKKNLEEELVQVHYRSDAISLVVACDDNFVPHFAALMESIKGSLQAGCLFDLYLLDGGISPKNKSLLVEQFNYNLKQSANIIFINCYDLYRDIPIHMHFAKPTFYRIDIGRLFSGFKRVIYLDSDMIIRADLRELWNIDLGDKAIGAVPDLVMKNFVKTNTPALSKYKPLTAKEYLRDYLKMGDAYDNYFQAGLLVIDIDKYIKVNELRALREDLMESNYWFLDQDLLNKYFLGRVRFLDTAWNCLNSLAESNNLLGVEWRAKIAEDLINPKIIHYAGYHAKPWNQRDAHWAEAYWFHLRKTYWYESVIFHKNELTFGANKSNINKKLKSGLRVIWRALPSKIKKFLMPLKLYLTKEI